MQTENLNWTYSLLISDRPYSLFYYSNTSITTYNDITIENMTAVFTLGAILLLYIPLCYTKIIASWQCKGKEIITYWTMQFPSVLIETNK